jgi:hypothetical protein
MTITPYHIYTAALIIAAITAASIGITAYRMNPQRLPQYESLPRWRGSGAVLAFLGLLWCIPHATPIVWNWMLPWLFPLVIICTVLAYLFLDYLLSRAIGGLLILSAYSLLHESFTFHTPLAAVLTIFCWALGIAGLFLSAKPHLLRDFIRCLSSSSRWRLGTLLFFAGFAGITLFAGISHCWRS